MSVLQSISAPRRYSEYTPVAQRPRARLPGGSGRLLLTLRHAERPGKLQLPPSPPGQPQVLAFVQGFSELLGRCAIVMCSTEVSRCPGAAQG